MLLLALLLASPAPLQEPPVFTSRDGQLDLVMVARPQPVELAGFTPTAWVYEVCPRTAAQQQSCPAHGLTAHPYGGVRLQIQPGDALKIRLVNRLPPAPAEAKHVPEMPEMLRQNPTNLHTHGLIVEPRRATQSDPTFGDYIYVYGYQPDMAPAEGHPGLEFTAAPIDYDIRIPLAHPAGLYWFHPHVHGLSLNQVTAGLGGLITVGDPAQYAKDVKGRAPALRHLMLKDLQILPDGTPQTQQDPSFCAADVPVNPSDRKGFCAGTGPSAGGKWTFSVNGQVFPEIAVHNPAGELWRIVNGSGSRTYQLALNDDANQAAIPLQVVAIDGVAVDGPQSAAQIAPPPGRAQRIRRTPCSAAAPAQAVCASSIVMMPSSRMEVWVPSSPEGRSGSATLITAEFATGPAGDDWPQIGLAHVLFRGDHGAAAAQVTGGSKQLTSPHGALGAAPTGPGTMSDEHAACAPLAAGHRRRIFFGLPASNPSAFGLGLEELDAAGAPVPGTFQDITPFDHEGISVCLPLGPNNQPVSEAWELVNVAGEDHNFHIHQTKFHVLSGANGSSQLGAMMDNVPVPHGGDGCDGSVASWRSGACTVVPVEVSIPFSQLGDFVYHCHILEHEDGGMMAHIRVVPGQ